jgi:acyl carrier protein
LVFLGRIDQQVKIRGLRIELGEIETVLAGHPSVAQVAVQPWADDAGEKHLVAYVSATPGSRPQRGELREYVAGELPRYMVPEYVVLLDTLPLTVSGKVDRRALPAPDERARGEVGTAEPTTETERVVAGIVADLLRLSRVGVHDNFFELGGNSLQATRAMSRIRDQLGVEVGLADFFQSPTVAHLAGVADRTGAGVPVAGGAAADIRGGDLDDEELLALIERLPADQAARLLDAAEG